MKSIVFLFCLLISGGAALAQQAGQQPTLSQDYFKKLRIETPGKQKPAPEFALNDLSGKAITLKSLRGKVVFLNFWATWCNPCRREMPAMEKLHREFRDRGPTSGKERTTSGGFYRSWG
ncbi:MAG: redoxin domain-containing protein [Deltaproteobacteria bacterium]|nr:MAG: redoxin domain-containing protein [Deltaproteobacteria bacterium]